MKGFFLLVSLLLLGSSLAWSQDQVLNFNGGNASYVVEQDTETVVVQGLTKTVRVQRKNDYRFWRKGDEVAVSRYLARYKCDLTAENYACLKDALPQLIGAGAIDARDCYGCIILNQTPGHYFVMWQTYCAAVNTPGYVRVPLPPPPPSLPCFVPGQRQGPLVLGEVPDCNPTPVCPPSSAPGGGYPFLKEGSYREVTLGQMYQRDVVRNQEQKSPYCPPGGTPGDPPNPGDLDPVGSGQPGQPPTGAHWGSGSQPPPQATHNTAGQPHDPLPTNRHVADPVR